MNCNYHNNVDASGVCVKCIKPVCSACTTIVNGEVVCKHCLGIKDDTTNVNNQLNTQKVDYIPSVAPIGQQSYQQQQYQQQSYQQQQYQNPVIQNVPVNTNKVGSDTVRKVFFVLGWIGVAMRIFAIIYFAIIFFFMMSTPYYYYYY